MKKMVLGMFVLVLSFSFVFSEEVLNENEKKAKYFVEKGLIYHEIYGEKKAFETFQDKESEFVDGEFYLFVIDFEGNTLAHGGSKKLVGKNGNKVL